MLNLDKMKQRVERFMEEDYIPGLALAIVRGQDIIYARGFGARSVEDEGAPVTEETLFRIGSITKPLTSTAIMRLVEEGKLELDRPIKAYFKDFRLSDPAASDQITLRMLLSHTAGLPTHYEPFGTRDPHALQRRSFRRPIHRSGRCSRESTQLPSRRTQSGFVKESSSSNAIQMVTREHAGH